mmetsp:Transcript_19608/g.55119  ORF Transcript_19608/g.55119 Transcript_19608/m.55119 type:complete len:240 (-) Transcript_19608:92-811(-)
MPGVQQPMRPHRPVLRVLRRGPVCLPAEQPHDARRCSLFHSNVHAAVHAQHGEADNGERLQRPAGPLPGAPVGPAREPGCRQGQAAGPAWPAPRRRGDHGGARRDAGPHGAPGRAEGHGGEGRGRAAHPAPPPQHRRGHPGRLFRHFRHALTRRCSRSRRGVPLHLRACGFSSESEVFSDRDLTLFPCLCVYSVQCRPTRSTRHVEYQRVSPRTQAIRRMLTNRLRVWENHGCFEYHPF